MFETLHCRSNLLYFSELSTVEWCLIKVKRCLTLQFTKYFLGDNDRVKFVLLLSGETEDEKLVLAASGTLAILSSEREICGKILTVMTTLYRLVKYVCNNLNNSINLTQKWCYLCFCSALSNGWISFKVSLLQTTFLYSIEAFILSWI